MQTPRGTRDLFGEELASIRHVMHRMELIFRRFGYEEVATPMFEHLELFTKKSGSNVVNQLYSFKDKASRDLVLRPELTTPVVRFYIHKMRASPKPIKVFYFGDCFRYEEPQAKRWRQFLQAGVEVIGAGDPIADAEVMALANDIMLDLGFKDHAIKMGHIRLLRDLLAHSGIKGDAQDPILRAIDSKEEKRIEEEVKLAGMKSSDEKILLDLISLKGGTVVLDKAGSLLEGIPRTSAALKNLRDIMECLAPLGVENFSLDLGIARGLDYYTDFVFEVYVGGVQIAGGGRYDGLVEQIGGEPTPAVGVAFGVDRISQTMLDRGMMAFKSRLDCLVLPVDDKVRAEALRIVTELRQAGLSVDTDFMGRSLGKAMQYANSLKVKHVVVVGAKELAKGQVVLRDMATGKQEEVAREGLSKLLKVIP